MRVVVFMNGLGLGGTEKAACRWARGLRERGHEVAALTLCDGPRRAELAAAGILAQVLPAKAEDIAGALQSLQPEVIHAHAPGQPHEGDVLGEALALLPKIPLVQTNIFGRLDNALEDRWTDFRLFISWTSAVQAARRSFLPLDAAFFRRASVAVYPLDPAVPVDPAEVERFRAECGVVAGEVLFGRLSRPEPNKWTELPLGAFRRARAENPRLKLLLREPPPEVARRLRASSDAASFVILPATHDAAALALTLASLDVVLHTSSVGESFGYGIAEPMNYGKPVITNSTPWADQAQVELVRDGECGCIASTTARMAKAILQLAADAEKREHFGRAGQAHIRRLADPAESLDRLEGALIAAAGAHENPRASEDLRRVTEAAHHLDKHQFGRTMGEQIALRPTALRVRFFEWRKACRSRTTRVNSTP